MRTTFAVLSALLVGAALGAAGVHELHAQNKPPVYVVTEIAVRNLTGYVNDYAPRAQESIKKAGGKILAASLNVTQLEGPAPTRVVIQVWDSPEQIAAYAHGPDYDQIVQSKSSRHQRISAPPSTLMVCPVTKLLASEQK